MGGKINKIKKVTTRFLSQLLCISTIIGTASCNDDQVFNQTDTTPLQVSVNAQGTQSSRAIIHGEYLSDGSSIGISLFTPEGADYDNQGYFNVKYTASGEGESQTWAAQGTTPSISANPANLLAYYPWSDDADLDLTAIPVENASQTDYMYAHPVTGITNANPKVNIIMQHALTAIRVNLVLGNYTGDAAVSGIAIKSSALGSAATMDITNNGALNGISGQGDEFALTTEFDLSANGTATDVLFVPDASVTEGSTTVSATIGGKKYTAVISFDEAYLQGYIYTYILTLNNTGFEVTKISVNPWNEGDTEQNTINSKPSNGGKYIIKIKAQDESQSDAIIFSHNVMQFVGSIDWGDGTTDSYTAPTDNPNHTYLNNGQEYTIIAKGTMQALSNNNFNSVFGVCLQNIVFIEDKCGITSFEYAFSGCKNLTTIPKGLFDACTEVTSFAYTFLDCVSLESIPEGLLDKCTKVESFNSMFSSSGPSVIMGLKKIPAGLFDNCTEVTDFEYVFAGCGNLQTIPEGLFDKCTKVMGFAGVFIECSKLTSIPEGLFDNCTEVMDFSGAFGGTGITFIPEGLFDKCTEVIAFDYTFGGCTNLEEIPSGLLDNNTKAKYFNQTFSGCTALTGESPYTTIQIDGVDKKVHLYERSNYPNNFTAPTSYSYCFSQCTGLTDYSSIPDSWL